MAEVGSSPGCRPGCAVAAVGGCCRGSSSLAAAHPDPAAPSKRGVSRFISCAEEILLANESKFRILQTNGGETEDGDAPS